MVKGVIQVRSKKTKPVLAYKNKNGQTFQVGDKVRLNQKTAFVTIDPMPTNFAGKPITSARIVSLFSDVKGLVLLENRLGGFWTWDVNDLKKVH